LKGKLNKKGTEIRRGLTLFLKEKENLCGENFLGILKLEKS